MKTLILTAIVTLFSINSSHACSVLPFDANAAIKEMNLDSVAMAALNINKEELLDVVEANVQGDYIWSNPMCPEGSWVSADYTITFQPAGTFGHGCTAVATVTKRVASAYEFRGVSKEGENKVIVDIKQNGICLD